MNINDWVDIRQDPNFFRTNVLSNWEYVIVKSLHDSGSLKVKSLLEGLSRFIVPPKHYDEELTPEKLKSRLVTTLHALKERGIVSNSSDGSWKVASNEEVSDERKKLVSWYLKVKK